ncbi:MAG TPA: class I SAM-dependent methyltransferase [Acidimicrobiales bacterium]|nr:class I SAM-dependent methyltransferase [Acidimicrobiales bacterium]
MTPSATPDTEAPAPAPAPIGLAPGVPLEAAGQDAAKYGSSNPVVRRLLDRWTAQLKDVIGPIGGTVVDIGIGEGLCLERVLRPVADSPAVDPRVVVGVEYRLDKARAAAQQLDAVDVSVGDAGMLPFPDRVADLVLCIEVLEHLPTVAPAVAELARVTGDRCVVSVPWEPWFRLGNLGRGKNVARLGNDPEHLHAFTPRKLRRTLERSFAEVRVVPVFPWLVAAARSPR